MNKKLDEINKELEALEEAPIDSISPEDIDSLLLKIVELPSDEEAKLLARINDLKKRKQDHDKVGSILISQ